MNNTKKLLCTLVAMLTLATGTLASTSCGGASPDSNGNNITIEEITPYDGSNVTITFYHTMGANLQDVLNKTILKSDPYVMKINETIILC